MKMIISKRQIILFALIIALGAAIYVNALFAKQDLDYDITQTVGGETESTANFGEAQFVSTSAEGDQYLAQMRLNRQQTRDGSIETISKIVQDAKLSDEDKQAALQQAMKFSEMSEKESKIENLIKAKGFSDCLVYLTDDKADVLIKTTGLTSDQVAQIADIIVKEANIKVENISIVEVK